MQPSSSFEMADATPGDPLPPRRSLGLPRGIGPRGPLPPRLPPGPIPSFSARELAQISGLRQGIPVTRKQVRGFRSNAFTFAFLCLLSVGLGIALYFHGNAVRSMIVFAAGATLAILAAIKWSKFSKTRNLFRSLNDR
ncbi:MAG TPA: hypothetical protein VFT82_00800 [Candidatus Paceibacterota bacterium]|nr:hypothetical protein [Candidatus Paceibacterota bacterium]